MGESIMPEVKIINPRAYLAPRIKRAGDFVSTLVHFLPETPLANHGDTLPTALRVEPDIRAEASDY